MSTTNTIPLTVLLAAQKALEGVFRTPAGQPVPLFMRHDVADALGKLEIYLGIALAAQKVDVV